MTLLKHKSDVNLNFHSLSGLTQRIIFCIKGAFSASRRASPGFEKGVAQRHQSPRNLDPLLRAHSLPLDSDVVVAYFATISVRVKRVGYGPNYLQFPLIIIQHNVNYYKHETNISFYIEGKVD